MADISAILGGTRNEIANLTWGEYVACPALNPSTIVHGLRSMRHLKYQWDKGHKDTDSMMWGRAVHCLLFEPSQFEQRYRAWSGRRAGKGYQDFMAAAWEDGAEVMKAEGRFSLESALEASQSFLGDKRVKELISAGQSEVTLFAVEGELQCKGRVDWISSSEHVLTDLKTTADLQVEWEIQTDGTRTPVLRWPSFRKFHYALKLGMYKRRLERVTQCHWPVEIIAMENTEPYEVVTIPIPDALLDTGMEQGLAIIGEVERCVKSGLWPGMTKGEPGELKVMPWEMEEETVEWADDEEESDG